MNPKPVLNGTVHVRPGHGGLVIQAPLGRTANYLSESLTPSGDLTIQFCLTAPRGVAARLVRLEPGGISLDLRRGHLELQASHPGRISASPYPLTVTGHPTAVVMAVDGNGRRVDLSVDGLEQGSFVTKGLAPSVVQIGSLVPARTGLITLTSVSISDYPGEVVLAPAPIGTTTRGTPPLPAEGTQPPVPLAAPLGQSAPGTGTASTAPPAAAVTPPGAGTASAPSTPAPPGPSSGGATSAGGISTAGGSTSSNGGTTANSGGGAVPQTPWPGNPFSPTSFWNLPLAPTVHSIQTPRRT